MRHANPGALVGAVCVAVCVLAVRGPTSVAQDTFGYLPSEGTDWAYAPAVTLRADEAPPADPTWTQRLARMTRGRTQLEGGYSFLRESSGGMTGTQHAFPDLLLRFGLTQRLELRLGWPGYVSSDSDVFVTGSSGTLDPNVGVLYDLWGQDGWLPQTAVLAAVPVTLEGNPFALSSLQPLAELMYAWQTGERTAISGRSGFAIFDVAGDNFVQFQQSLSLDAVLTERIGAFVSWDMLSDRGSMNDARQHMAGGGLSFLLTERLVVSWRSAVGLNAAAPDFLTDIRFAYRF